jgi:hypothetical protein
MSFEEISQAKKLSNLVNISRGRGIPDSSEFVSARKKSIEIPNKLHFQSQIHIF